MQKRTLKKASKYLLLTKKLIYFIYFITMSTVDNGQTCLEKRGMEERHEELPRRHYNREDAYGANHKDARSDGDVQGKGTGGGHNHYLPDCTKPKGQIDYSNFSTSPFDQIGGYYDIEGRNDLPGRRVQMARSIYSHLSEYGAKLVDTSANQAEGQYVMK